MSLCKCVVSVPLLELTTILIWCPAACGVIVSHLSPNESQTRAQVLTRYRGLRSNGLVLVSFMGPVLRSGRGGGGAQLDASTLCGWRGAGVGIRSVHGVAVGMWPHSYPHQICTGLAHRFAQP